MIDQGLIGHVHVGSRGTIYTQAISYCLGANKDLSAFVSLLSYALVIRLTTSDLETSALQVQAKNMVTFHGYA